MTRPAAARWAERAGWVVCGLAVVFGIFAFTSKPLGDDLDCIIASARAARDGLSPYLAPPPDRPSQVVCIAHPPPTLFLFEPIAAVGTSNAAVPAAAFDAALAFVLAAVLVAPLPRTLRPWVGVGIALYFPLLLELNVLNLNVPVLLLALAASSDREGRLPAGLALAGAIGLKVIGSPLVLFYAAAGRWRHLAWATLALIAVAVATAPWVGWLWGDWLPQAIWRATTSEGLGIRPRELGGTIAYPASALVAASLMVAAGIGARRVPAHAADLHALALAAIPLFARWLVYPNLVLALPLFAAVTRALAPRPILLVLPAGAWLLVQMPLGMEAWRFAGLVAIVCIGAAVFLPRALVRTDG